MRREECMGYYKVLRKDLIQELENYLVGPHSAYEILGKELRPMQFYLTGKLVPLGSSSDVINERDNAIETHVQVNEEELNEQLTLKKIFRPSTMGISFKLKELTTVEIEASWAIYEGEEHKRMPQSEKWSIDLVAKSSGILENHNESKYGKVRYMITYRNNLYHVNVFLLNSLKRDDQYPQQNEVMFQCQLKVHIKSAYMAKFTSKADQYHLQNELLYRDKEELAIGHGVSVDWEEVDKNIVIYSTWMPKYELPHIEHSKIENQSFKMTDLSNSSPDELKKKLDTITVAYKNWLEHELQIINQLEPYLKIEAEKNVLRIQEIIKRLEEGIALVTESSNSLSYIAFQFANRAMVLQRAQSTVAQTYRSTGERIKSNLDGEWRLFQLIFLLINIAGASDEQHDDRKIVDLIWFPTGGGKTEAYLGVAAYVMAYRRLLAPNRVEKYAGVTVFMRYTLRLLTTQQFQRAASLICAAELLRKNRSDLFGEEPFSIGLWIGKDSSPNTFEDAIDKLEQLREGKEVKSGNPIQLMNCPWCGSELGPEQYEVTDKAQKICCSNQACSFKHGIPVYTIDEAIYKKTPYAINWDSR